MNAFSDSIVECLDRRGFSGANEMRELRFSKLKSLDSSLKLENISVIENSASIDTIFKKDMFYDFNFRLLIGYLLLIQKGLIESIEYLRKYCISYSCFEKEIKSFVITAFGNSDEKIQQMKEIQKKKFWNAFLNMFFISNNISHNCSVKKWYTFSYVYLKIVILAGLSCFQK